MTRLGALLWVLVSACQLDDRVLHGASSGGRGGGEGRGGEGRGGEGRGGEGHGGEGRGGNGSSSAAGAGPTGGTPPLGGSPGAKCADLDRDFVLDCEETLLDDSTFDLGVERWSAEADADVYWDVLDALSNSASGSLGVRNLQSGEGPTLGMVGAAYCVSVAPGDRYALYAETYIEAEAQRGFAGATAWFYDAPGCTGTLLEAAASPLQGAINAWKVIRLRPIVVPAQAVSMSLRLAAAKELGAEPFTVKFDNVLFSR